MKKKRSNDGSILAADLMAELAANAGFQSALAQQAREDEERFAVPVSLPLLDALAGAGFRVAKLRDVLDLDASTYRSVLPVLLEHLRRSEASWEKAAIASLFVTAKARGAGQLLIKEFERLPPGSEAKWQLGNALAEC